MYVLLAIYRILIALLLSGNINLHCKSVIEILGEGRGISKLNIKRDWKPPICRIFSRLHQLRGRNIGPIDLFISTLILKYTLPVIFIKNMFSRYFH